MTIIAACICDLLGIDAATAAAAIIYYTIYTIYI